MMAWAWVSAEGQGIACTRTSSWKEGRCSPGLDEGSRMLAEEGGGVVVLREMSRTSMLGDVDMTDDEGGEGAKGGDKRRRAG